MEIFKNIQDSDRYLISNLGNVKSLITNKILKPAKDAKGYLRCGLMINGKLKTYKVHRLVAKAFVENLLNKPQVNHKNGIKHDNRVDNLEWVTNKENQIHAIENGLTAEINDEFKLKCVNKYIKKGSEKPNTKLKESDVIEIRAKYNPKIISRNELAKEYNITLSCIKDILSRKSWKHI